jgi:hypothetical protein
MDMFLSELVAGGKTLGAVAVDVLGDSSLVLLRVLDRTASGGSDSEASVKMDGSRSEKDEFLTKLGIVQAEESSGEGEAVGVPSPLEGSTAVNTTKSLFCAKLPLNRPRPTKGLAVKGKLRGM